MPRITITDLPGDMKISKEEMRSIIGGINPQPEPPGYWNEMIQPITFLRDIPMNSININVK